MHTLWTSREDCLHPPTLFSPPLYSSIFVYIHEKWVEWNIMCLMVPSAVYVLTLHVITDCTSGLKCMWRERHTNVSPNTAFIQKGNVWKSDQDDGEHERSSLEPSMQMLLSKNNIPSHWLQALCISYATVKNAPHTSHRDDGSFITFCFGKHRRCWKNICRYDYPLFESCKREIPFSKIIQ